MDVWWPDGIPACVMRNTAQGGPLDNRVSFEPELGPPIERPRGTAVVEVFDIELPPMSSAQVEIYETWFRSDIAFGAIPYVWRDPISDAVTRWKILKGDPTYRKSQTTKGKVIVTFRAMRLPSAPWYASYVRPMQFQPPQVVADWDAGVYGIGGQKVAASALPAVSGTFDVYSVSSTDVETFTAGVVIMPGDIPATAPALVKRRVYFTP